MWVRIIRTKLYSRVMEKNKKVKEYNIEIVIKEKHIIVGVVLIIIGLICKLIL